MAKTVSINGATFKQLIESGANHLTNRHVEIDALNVFPVPDGDTGTNMNLTFQSGVADALKVNSDKISEVAKVFSKGLLMGARGNSGVILSQIFRGFSMGVEGLDQINAFDMAKAFVKGSEVAYKAVMRPVEGTILTVLREGATNSLAAISKQPDVTIEQYMEILIQQSQASLQRTPELLPVLKEVGVVDSGGAGLLVIFEGINYALAGQPVTIVESAVTKQAVQAHLENEEFGYCTEFIVRLTPEKQEFFQEEALRNALARLGDSIVVVQDEDLVKVHIHTLTPGDALNLAQRHGEFVKLKIENMQEQHAAIVDDSSHSHDLVGHNHAHHEKPKSKYAIVAVAAGDGLAQAFKDLRVDVVISGGQTMNPATEDFVGVIEKCNAEHIIILPNNSNIILAAQQAESILEDINVHVLMSKTIAQGLSACIMFNPEVAIEENLQEMNDAIARVKSGSITYAIKDTVINKTEIKANQFMGIFEKDIIISTDDKLLAATTLLDAMIADSNEICTIIVGEDATESEVNHLVAHIEKNHKVEVEIITGDQPVYSFIFGVE